MKLTITTKYLKEHGYDFTLDKKGHITVNGNFSCSNNQLTKLVIPDNFTCGGNFFCGYNQLKELVIPDNFTCGGGFFCYNNQLTKLVIPDNFTCGGDFSCSNNQLKELVIPDNFTCGRGFFCYNNQLTKLVIPDNFTCGGGFYCDNNQLKELVIPDNFTCGGGFYCDNNQLKELVIPDNFTCGGGFYCDNNQLTKQPKIKTYKTINILKWQNSKYIKVDGIFCEVLKNIKNTFVCKKIGRKNIFYIFGKNDVFAHGNTPKQAYLDWLFKTSERDVSEYKKINKTKEYDLNFWVVAYRTITGACTFGTNEYLENNKDKYKSKMTLNKVFKATQGQYGHNTFVNFFKN